MERAYGYLVTPPLILLNAVVLKVQFWDFQQTSCEFFGSLTCDFFNRDEKQKHD